ncbi:hypothetical protein ACFZAV_43045 [Streptomyces sp. NPDC008343]|uniref:hypothetical protein n=1 Tax=Streptomyces sp. NPDC008343 TaxID=3364828 RepID=UPI0036EDB449
MDERERSYEEPAEAKHEEDLAPAEEQAEEVKGGVDVSRGGTLPGKPAPPRKL